MGNFSPSELLLRIALDPSNAEGSIQQFSSKFSGTLRGLENSLTQWSGQSKKSFEDTGKSIDHLKTNFGTSFNSLTSLFTQNRKAAADWKSSLTEAFNGAISGSGALRDGLLGSFQAFDSALIRNTGSATVWQKSVGEAFTKAAVTSIGALAKQAVVHAIYSSALGFYLMAIGDFSGAAQAFESAAVFGSVGGAAALATSALSGGSSSSSKKSSHSSDVAKSSSSSEKAASGASSKPQQTVQIVFQGPIYGGQAGIDQLTREISRAVQERDVNLVAYTTVRQPARRA